jgi:hypothetical protein
MRVFNTLLHNGQLEPKQIADFIMREHKETRELLYRMFKAGYLQMQVSDRPPGTNGLLTQRLTKHFACCCPAQQSKLYIVWCCEWTAWLLMADVTIGQHCAGSRLSRVLMLPGVT